MRPDTIADRSAGRARYRWLTTDHAQLAGMAGRIPTMQAQQSALKLNFAPVLRNTPIRGAL
eukprot:COSAG01_NODE_11088_length_2010_cov_2.363161_5_plen_61_part_00